ncbi:glycosyltransferase [Acidobacteriota bacterium]
MTEKRKTLVIWSAEPREMAFLSNRLESQFPHAEFSLLVGKYRDRIVKNQIFSQRYVHSMPTKRFRVLGLEKELRRRLVSEGFENAVLPSEDDKGHFLINGKLSLLLLHAEHLFFYHHKSGFRRISKPRLVADILYSIASRAALFAIRQIDVLIFLLLMLLALPVGKIRRRLNQPSEETSSGPLSIAYFITSLGLGGAQRQLLLAAEQMAQRGHAPFTLAWLMTDEFYNGLFVEKGLDMSYIRRTGGFFSLGVLRLYRRLRKQRPLILHNWLFLANMVGSVAGNLAGVPCIISSVRNINLWKKTWYKKWWYYTGDWLTGRLNWRLLGNSEAVSEDTRDWLSLPPERVVTVVNGILPEWIDPLSLEEISQKREKLGLGQNVKIALICGRLAAEKDHRTFFKAFKQAGEKVANLHALVIGGGELEEELVSFCMDEGIAASVTFMGSRLDVHAWMQIADIIVQSSIIEGLPNVIMEALLLERPVAATNAGGTGEIIKDRETGLLVPVGDAEVMAAAMEELLIDKNLARNMAVNGRQHVLEYCEADKMSDTLLRLYEGGLRRTDQ